MHNPIYLILAADVLDEDARCTPHYALAEITPDIALSVVDMIAQVSQLQPRPSEVSFPQPVISCLLDIPAQEAEAEAAHFQLARAYGMLTLNRLPDWLQNYRIPCTDCQFLLHPGENWTSWHVRMQDEDGTETSVFGPSLEHWMQLAAREEWQHSTRKLADAIRAGRA